MDRGASQATVHGVTKGWTQLSADSTWMGRFKYPGLLKSSFICIYLSGANPAFFIITSYSLITIRGGG